MTSVYTFPNLTLAEKGNLVFNEGNYLAVRQYYGYFINLYLVEDTFVEVWYQREENKIEKIEILDDMKKLDLYIMSMQNL